MKLDALSDVQYESLCDRIMQIEGVTADHASFVLIESAADNGVFIKFMSHGAVTDTANGNALMKYLNEHHIRAHHPDPADDPQQQRKVIVKEKAFMDHFFPRT